MFKEPLHPFPHTALYAFSLTTPPPFERTHFMCNPKVIHNEETSKINTFFFTKFVYDSLFGRILKKLRRGVFRTQSNIKLVFRTESNIKLELFVKIVSDLQIVTI